jgi:beta-lactamase superfamily II metal-dependent hydrolase
MGTDISAKYLKVPHHGSKENLSLDIIKIINPKAAIISHKNRIFSSSPDPHPHIEVLNYFDSLGIDMYFTNDVKKGGPALRSAYRGILDEFIEFK